MCLYIYFLVVFLEKVSLWGGRGGGGGGVNMLQDVILPEDEIAMQKNLPWLFRRHINCTNLLTTCFGFL